MQRNIAKTLDGFVSWAIEETITSPKGGVMYIIVRAQFSENDKFSEFIVFADGDVVEL
jgi:ABC-type phosphate transport system ATPase subunit